jgi:prephenate dehydrogenase
MEHHGFSAGSFRDMTRVARLDEHMWTELFSLNREPLLEELDHLIAHLTQYREALAAGDNEAMRSLLREGRERKEIADRKADAP